MNSKQLIIKGQVEDLTFEECYNQFTALKHLFLKKWRRFNTVDEEDKEQEINIALYAAYKRYDVTLGTEFITVAYATINMYMMNMYRDMRREKRKVNHASVSLDESINTDDTQKEIYGMDTVKVYDDHDLIELNLIIKNRLNEKENKIVRLSYQGYSQQEIAEILGCSQVSVCRYKKKIADKLKAVC